MMQHDVIQLLGREVHLRVWNPDTERTVVCWHGLARNGFDFEPLGEALAADGWRVLAPDTPGRGWSQWADQPRDDYQFGRYMPLAEALLDHYDVNRLSWVGTSMGGLLGMLLTGKALAGRVDRLVLNDIGPAIPTEALRRITDYVRQVPSFATLSEFETRIRELYAPFGPRSDADWRAMAMACSRRLPDGRFVTHYDPEIVGQFDESAPPLDLWSLFEALDCPLQLLHGTQSDVLTNDIVARMRECQPGLEVHGFDNCGHAPGLHLEAHIEPVRRFLRAGA